MTDDRKQLLKLRAQLVLCLSVVPLLYLIPTHSVYHGHTICVFKNLFGTECWGCGMTRALFSLLYLNFDQAWHYNRMVVVVAPLLLYLYLRTIYRLYVRIKNSPR